MVARKHLKQLVRARMQKTGESYATARRHIVRTAPQPTIDPTIQWHFPGNVPATTALRVVISHAGIRAPHTDEPFSEALLFGIAGGIGAGCCSFYYEKEGFASFHLAGRHRWIDDLGYLADACEQLGAKTAVHETSGAKTAEKKLLEVLERGPCIAWVDMAHLPHRAMPARYSGGGYHVVTIYRTGDDEQSVLIGDLTDEPIAVSLKDLATARGRIKKQKCRLLCVTKTSGQIDLQSRIRNGLQLCHDGLAQQKWKMFTLEAFRTWGERLHGSKDKESWDRVFAPGNRAWRGLVSAYDCIEHYGTGGGLCRPLYADFLAEASEALKDRKLAKVAGQYEKIGQAWTALAHAALPNEVPLFHEAKNLCAEKSELTAAGAPAEQIRAIWDRLDELERNARDEFPLTDAAYDKLRADLQQQVRSVYEQELAAHAALGNYLA